MRGARRFHANESLSNYTLFQRICQGYLKNTAYIWQILCFLVYLHPVFQRDESFVSIYNKVRA